MQKQTYGNWELCLADGSDDAHAYVGEICRELAGKDERIRYRKLEKNEGIAGNTNQCLTMATGEYIGLFDHDDMLHPCVLFEYVKAINEKNADYVYCDEATFKNGDINPDDYHAFQSRTTLSTTCGPIIISAISAFFPESFWTGPSCSARNSTAARIMI